MYAYLHTLSLHDALPISAELAVVVVAVAAGQRQSRKRLDDPQRVDAVDVRALAVGRPESEEIIIVALMLVTEDQLRLLRRRHHPLIFEAQLGARLAVIGRRPADRQSDG